MDPMIAQILVRCGAVSFRTDPFYTFTSGTKSPVYVDNRRLLGFPAERRKVVAALRELVESSSRSLTGNKSAFNAVAGTATAGIPWAAWLADGWDKPLLYVRGAKKPHGRETAVEGYAPAGSRVLLVEDLMFTGGSTATSIANLREAGYDVATCVAIVTYGTRTASERLEELDVSARVLTSVEAALRVAHQSGDLTSAQLDIVQAWLADTRK